MSYSVFGYVVGVRRFATGDIEIDFLNNNKTTVLKYSTNSKNSLLTKDLAESLSSTLGTDLCAEVFFDRDGNITHIELEECEYEDEEIDDLR